MGLLTVPQLSAVLFCFLPLLRILDFLFAVFMFYVPICHICVACASTRKIWTSDAASSSSIAIHMHLFQRLKCLTIAMLPYILTIHCIYDSKPAQEAYISPRIWQLETRALPRYVNEARMHGYMGLRRPCSTIRLLFMRHLVTFAQNP